MRMNNKQSFRRRFLLGDWKSTLVTAVLTFDSMLMSSMKNKIIAVELETAIDNINKSTQRETDCESSHRRRRKFNVGRHLNMFF